ncbi:RHS repeat-associated core domain-containing protein, partial [Salegentibacter salinarum]
SAVPATSSLLGDISIYRVGSSVSGLKFSTGNNKDFLQEIDYAYNIRGWLKQINDPENLGDDLFGFGINYNDPTGGAPPLYNGNISETHWNTQSENISGNPVSNYYGYSYDALNRITGATDNTGNYNLSGIAYDKMGNILSLQRQGQTDAGATFFGTMDDLGYDYDGNRLMKVSDSGEKTWGFKEPTTSTGNDYEYDVNGNLTSNANKGIAAGGIEYNHLNMPTKITVSNAGSNNGVIDYVYTADGIKLQKKKTQGEVATTTDYAGDFVYENNTLKQFYQPEGYVEPDGSDWQYVYQYRDIWGNTRITYADDDNSGSVTSAEIRREQNYYPFGLEHKGYNNYSYGAKNNLKTYQGQEFTEDLGLNTHEWKYRMSDPAIGRFWQIDPLAEDYTYNSTYAFQENKMGLGTELEGKELDPFGVARTVSYYSRKAIAKTVETTKRIDTYLKSEGGGFNFRSKNGGNGDPGRDGGRNVEMVDADGLLQAAGFAKTGGTMGPKKNPKDYGEVAKNVFTIAANTLDGMETGGEIVEETENLIEATAKFPTGEVIEGEGNFKIYPVKDSMATFETQIEADNFKKQAQTEKKKLIEKTYENQ